MARTNQDIEFIVRYEPDMEREVEALLIVLGCGKARPRADTGTGERGECTDAEEKQASRDGP